MHSIYSYLWKKINLYPIKCTIKIKIKTLKIKIQIFKNKKNIKIKTNNLGR